MNEILKCRTLLKEELVKRQKINPLYSARAMAKNLNVSPGFFCQVLGGKRKLSEEKARLILQKLNWGAKKKKLFLNLVRLESTVNAEVRSQLLSEILSQKNNASYFHNIEIDQFAIIADSYHYAILELTETADFLPSADWIARKLNLTVETVELAVERLLRIGLLKQERKKLTKSWSDYTAGREIPADAIRKFHTQNLEKAKVALQQQQLSSRDFSGITMAINPKMIPKAKKKMAKYRRELMKILETGTRTTVYQLSFQLFRVDQDLG